MAGKWTDRGIEDSHGHLIADLEGTVVCTKRKDREEVPVGKMILERIKEPRELPFIEGSAIEELLENDSWFQNLRISLEEANSDMRRAAARAITHREQLIQHIKEMAYDQFLAAPDLETLNSDKRFACPSHPKVRFLWEQIGVYGNPPSIVFYRRLCMECSLPKPFKRYPVAPYVNPARAYSCTTCGLVYGIPRKETEGAYGHVDRFYCVLCGKLLAESVHDLGR